jgi:hypothetical protein
MIARTLVAFLFLASAAIAAEREDIDFVAGASLPPEVWEALTGGNLYAIVSAINPFYLQGDFDGDGWRDTAVLVKERASGKKGAAIVFKGGKVRIVGAGKDVGDGTTSLDWMDAWYVERRGEVMQGATDEAPPTMKGDGIMAIKTESASGLIYWDGDRFRFYQQGD